MKKEYVKPELYKEEFCLSEHVAKGCTEVTITVVTGGSITVDRVCCKQVSDKEFGSGAGKGHWDARNVTIYDDNKNGNIDWAEIVKYCGTAINGNVTGGGHNGHEVDIKLPSETVVSGTPENS